MPISWPIELPPGEWHRTLQTTWVEPGYLEPDASWCEPGGEPATPLANGGAFGGKVRSEVGAVARRLADEHGRPVRVLFTARTSSDTARSGRRSPPALRADGTGVIRVVRTPGIVERMLAAAGTGVAVEEVDVLGPPTSTSPRAAGWAEVAVLRSSLGDAPDTVTSPAGATATATVDAGGVARAGALRRRRSTTSVLRSYCTGAAHMALGWVRSEGLAVGADGVPADLTIRSFGILRAADTPPITVEIEPDDGPPVNGSDAVFAAVAAAAWRLAGHPPRWPRASVRPMSKPLGPYSPFVRAGDFVIVSGQGGMLDGRIVEGGVGAQTTQTMANVAARLAEAGAELGDVVKTLCFLTDMGTFAEFNDAYAAAFGDHRPARSTVEVSALPGGMAVEVEAWAYKPS